MAQPARLYAIWLPDGDHPGQEILYDEKTDPNTFFGHLGGSLHIASWKIAIDGPFAHALYRGAAKK